MRTSHPERRTPTIRQFILIMTALTWFALLLPVGARATGQLVTLVDPSTSSKARVDAGKLRVGDGSGALSVDGRVGRYPAPGVGKSVGGLVSGAGEKPIAGPFAAGVRLAITSLTLANFGSGPTRADLMGMPSPPAETAPTGWVTARWPISWPHRAKWPT